MTTKKQNIKDTNLNTPITPTWFGCFKFSDTCRIKSALKKEFEKEKIK
jgi:hypothetical protein